MKPRGPFELPPRQPYGRHGVVIGHMGTKLANTHGRGKGASPWQREHIWAHVPDTTEVRTGKLSDEELSVLRASVTNVGVKPIRALVKSMFPEWPIGMKKYATYPGTSEEPMLSVWLTARMKGVGISRNEHVVEADWERLVGAVFDYCEQREWSARDYGYFITVYSKGFTPRQLP